MHLVVVLGVMLSAGAAEEAEAEPPTYETIVVTGVAPLADAAPIARTRLEGAALDPSRSAFDAAAALAFAPGLAVQNRYNFAQDLRLSIRGFGDRAAFGVRGIKVFLDGIPLTLADGQTVLDGLDLPAIGEVTVVRAPAAVLYGNSAGGALLFSSAAPAGPPRLTLRTEAGSFGTTSVRAGIDGVTGGTAYSLSAYRFGSDGHRERSETSQGGATLRLAVPLGARARLSALANLHLAPTAEDPGGLTSEQLDTSPDLAAPTSEKFRTRESASQLRAGVALDWRPSAGEAVTAALHAAARQLRNAIPARFIELGRMAPGGYASYRREYRWLGAPAETLAGASFEQLSDERQNFTNETGDPLEPLLLDQRESVTSAGVFVQQLVEPVDSLTLMAGARYDWVRFHVDDRLGSDGDDSGTRHFRIWSAHGGATLALARAATVYADVAQAFETPTTTELVNRPDGGGGLNPELEPQRALSYELGLRGESSRVGTLRYALAAYRIELRDELVRREDATARAYYVNAGRSHRDGLEATVSAVLAGDARVSVAYTLLRAVFDVFDAGGVSLAGKRVPGVPLHRASLGLSHAPERGLQGGLDVTYATGVYVDDANTDQSPRTLSVDARAGYRARVGSAMVDVFGGARNLLDERYCDNVRINARGARYFEPAPPRSYYLGLGVGYELP